MIRSNSLRELNALPREIKSQSESFYLSKENVFLCGINNNTTNLIENVFLYYKNYFITSCKGLQRIILIF